MILRVRIRFEALSFDQPLTKLQIDLVKVVKMTDIFASKGETREPIIAVRIRNVSNSRNLFQLGEQFILELHLGASRWSGAHEYA